MNPLFHSTDVTDEQTARITQIQDSFEKLFNEIMAKTRPSRFRSKALTGLVDACKEITLSICIEGKDADRY